MLFACIFVPDLGAEALVRVDPDLRDAALAIVEGRPPLLTVIAANEHARQSGVEYGMTNLQAAARLNRSVTAAHPGVIRLRSCAQELAAHAALADCARAISPRVEECAAAPDTVLLDIEGLERLFGSPQKIARELARRASELGLETNVAVSTNLDAAICAARGFSGITVLPPGKEADRLAPLPIEILLHVAAQDTSAPASPAHTKRKKSARENTVGKQISAERAAEILETLDRWGVHTFRALAALPEIAVAERLGPEGVYLQKLCRGEGDRTLVPTDRPLVFEETIELEYPIDDLEPLAFVLGRLLEQVCARLSARALSTNELRLRMELEDSGHYDIANNQSGCNAHPEIYERVLQLPVPMLDTRIFLRLWQLELRTTPPAAAVTRVWLRAEPVQPRNTQRGLFLPSAPEPERLELTLARIAALVSDNKGEEPRPDVSKNIAAPSHKANAPFDTGTRFVRSTHTVTKPGLNEMISLEAKTPSSQDKEARPQSSNVGVDATDASGSLRIGSPEILDTHRPDAFRMTRFSPSNTSSESTAGAQTDIPASSNTGITAMRLFRPPLAANVDVIDGHPAWLDTTDSEHTDQALSGEIAWCSGPWRTSGEWWNNSWFREEWDVAVENMNGRVVCRVYRDEKFGAWFVEGIYD